MSIASDFQDIWWRTKPNCAVMEEPIKAMMQHIRTWSINVWECDTKNGDCVKFFEFTDFSILKVEQTAGNQIVALMGYDCTTIEDNQTEGD